MELDLGTSARNKTSMRMPMPSQEIRPEVAVIRTEEAEEEEKEDEEELHARSFRARVPGG